MSDFIHCNRCFTTKNAKFMLGQCFHVSCEKCILKDPQKHCPVCKKPAKYVPIGGKMPESLKIYFSDSSQLIEKELAKLQKQYDFQNGMATHLLGHLKKEKEKIKKMEHVLRKKCRDDEVLRKEYESAKKWIEMAEEKMKKQENEIDELKQQMARLEGSDFRGATDHTSKFRFLESDADSQFTVSSIQSSNSSFHLLSPIRSPPIQTQFEEMEVDQQNFSNPFVAPKTADAKQFVNVFNNMITPGRHYKQNVPDKTITGDKTSLSLDDQTLLNASDKSRRETSLPPRTPTKYQSYAGDYSVSGRERQFPRSVQELRRNASQKGIVTRNSIIPSSYLNLGD